MRPRPRAPRAYSRFPSCHSPPTRARLRLPALPRPADWPPRASPRGPLTSLAPRLPRRRCAGAARRTRRVGARFVRSRAPARDRARAPACRGWEAAGGWVWVGRWVRAVSAPRSRCSLYLPSLLPSYFPLHQSPSLLQAAEAAHEARLHEATQGLEAELRALEAASLSSEARHV